MTSSTAAARARKAGLAAGERRRRRAQRPQRLPNPATCERDYSLVETIVQRAAERYRQERHAPFMTLGEYIQLFRTNGWLNESAILASLAKGAA